MNYKNFWESGLAKRMIDEFYGCLPFPPPMLYLDVLNAQGGNFSTGAPDGPLGGSVQTQVEGMQAIADYLRSKGTDLGTEGNRPFLGRNAAGLPRRLRLAARRRFLRGRLQRDFGRRRRAAGSAACFGNPGAFNVSPVASTRGGLDRVRASMPRCWRANREPRSWPI